MRSRICYGLDGGNAQWRRMATGRGVVTCYELDRTARGIMGQA